jgi:hypothetical protein
MLKDNEQFKNLIEHWRNMSSYYEDPIVLAVKYDRKIYPIIINQNGPVPLRIFYYIALCHNYNLDYSLNENLLLELQEYITDCSVPKINDFTRYINKILSNYGVLEYTTLVEEHIKKALKHPIEIV